MIETAQIALEAGPCAFLLIWVKSQNLLLCNSDRMNEKPVIDASQEKVVLLDQETRFAPNGIVSRTLLRTDNMRVVLFGFSEGQELTEHTSTQHALVQILSGECEFSLAGKPTPLKGGDMVCMPPGLAHAVRATKQFSMLLTLSKPVSGIPGRIAGSVSSFATV